MHISKIKEYFENLSRNGKKKLCFTIIITYFSGLKDIFTKL